MLLFILWIVIFAIANIWLLWWASALIATIVMLGGFIVITEGMWDD